METIVTDPRLVTVSLVVGAFALVASAFPKILGPVGDSISALMLKARRTSDELEGIELAAIKRRLDVVEEQRAATETRLRADLEHMRSELACRDARLSAMERSVVDAREISRDHDVALIAHAQWDRTVMVRLAAVGITIPPPPPLWPGGTTT